MKQKHRSQVSPYSQLRWQREQHQRLGTEHPDTLAVQTRYAKLQQQSQQPQK